ncbi:universal stress protein [Umezawaea sp. Da 62-37]|uniref:universal stress protein n=1 Tax=Umezawaea sp. Da 62-37 TaxID=3075927 RepID=UPI0028F70E12|nr:universal stress protein [Umezawaea sp. Da 62-37]WNV84836.1 universal stress protein [Umezawaea sp. Da 62-37]
MGTGHRIIVGIDGSPASTAALKWAVREARRNRSPVLAVSVSPFRAKPSLRGLMPITLPAGDNPFREQHLRDLRNASSRWAR